ncbi:hypothetical protein [Leptospira kirschneri]|uniref:Uncharacterized protein n=1 Tax=Leptospira kirschneri str. 200802841 TaxID=1193047 RepID=A0A828Y1D0_9LEPT|nr:hypothetical protein [Leptospira kirschneri]EKO51535.1 hypothetical protein LEP1GSC131_0391 [Leptospira kirschneri str. 200802841]EMK05998.1 hypothetical protein LEP1GSC176_1489 [Leptospira kirschneri str. MMD1493]EMN24016.1 hypothetical protein LEP1GSC065_1604 [Leptospira kirschneri serovar Sokoine str. RM1]EMO68641.1 hypothetical protein LEP1GSC132_0377 [Leptospira kirschneri str. 200803703]EMO76301.1 hypothetical protein LEP1GSC127_1077 [Leptospira kirschneri str. 200801925]
MWKDFQEPLSLNIGSEKRTLSYQYHVQPSRFEEIEFYFLPGNFRCSFTKTKENFTNTTCSLRWTATRNPFRCSP